MRLEPVPTYDEFIKCERPDCVYDNAVAIVDCMARWAGNGPYTVCANCGDLLSNRSTTKSCMTHTQQTEGG
jgi:hypothetical protein